MRNHSPARPFLCNSNSFLFEWCCTRTRFENEAKGNSKINGICFSSAFVQLGKLSRRFLAYSKVKPKPIVIYSRTSVRMDVITSSFDWLAGLSVSFVIGQSDFGFAKLDSFYLNSSIGT